MKMTAKLKRVDFQNRSSFENVKIDREFLGEELRDQEKSEFDKLSEFEQVIYPWQQFYSKTSKKNYFFNRKTQESVWELPEDIKKKSDLYYSVKLKHKKKLKQKNYEKILGKIYKKEEIQWRERPAIVQKKVTDKQEVAYEEGDEEYNIWYDKKIQDEIIPTREGAKTKCNPFTDSGFTQADQQNKQAYFCIHFAKGNCYMGSKCHFYHHIPNLQECLEVDNSKDIFGRARFATHRKDNMGIGNYMKESRTLKVKDFCVPTEKEIVLAGYEMLLRHFSCWGEIEDLYFLPTDNIAFIRYEHRCMAEFAKECMMDQVLDSDEVLTVAWATSDCFELDDANYQELQDTLREQEEKDKEEKKQKSKKNFLNPEKQKRTMKEYEEEQEMIKKIEKQFELQSDPSKKILENHYKGFEHRQQQQKLSQQRLRESMKKIKKETVDYNEYFKTFNQFQKIENNFYSFC